MKIEEPSEAFRNMAFTIGGIFHLFYNSHQGNLLLSQSKDVFNDVYVSKRMKKNMRFIKLVILFH